VLSISEPRNVWLRHRYTRTFALPRPVLAMLIHRCQARIHPFLILDLDQRESATLSSPLQMQDLVEWAIASHGMHESTLVSK